MDSRIVVFLKAPRPGQVKTRLAASIGKEAACLAYGKLAETFLKTLKAYSNVELRYAPDEAGSEILPFKLRPEWTLKPQGDGDLGQRMERAVKDVLSEVDAVLCIGTDCPYVTNEDLDQAFQYLGNHDAVFGPAKDGGYWALGLRKPAPFLFREMPWSTPQVLEISLNRLKEAHLSYGKLRELEDVDDLESWLRFKDWAH